MHISRQTPTDRKTHRQTDRPSDPRAEGGTEGRTDETERRDKRTGQTCETKAGQTDGTEDR